MLLDSLRFQIPRLSSHSWLSSGCQDRGKNRAENVLDLSIEVVHRTPKPPPKKVARIWAEERPKEGQKIK